MAVEDSAGSEDAAVETSDYRGGKKRKGPATPARVARDPPPNGIQASRTARKSPGSQAVGGRETDSATVPEASQATSSAPRTGALPRADADPWTVPQSVRDRFVQDGHRFYFPDGNPAFRDLGRRLTTPSENTQVIHSLIQIAHSRGWTEVTVTGTERFRHEAWRQARMAGLNVRGFRPNEEQRAQLVRALGQNLPQRAERVDGISADTAPAGAPEVGAPGTGQGGVRERIVGRLLDHGKDAYRHDPNEDPSYFVRLQTREGPREIWGKDIERAVAKSLTQPQRGEEVVLQRTGRDAVTVQRPEKDAEGNLQPKAVEVFRNRWVIEKREFFEQRAAAAQIVRNERIAPREAVREHPELAGTYLNLRAADLAARGLRDPQDQRRFVAQVRRALADDIERGEPLQPVRLRGRAERRLVEDPERGR
jgi:hypothetical protein